LKTLHKLVLKAFFTPFLGTFFTMLFVLLMQNVWKYVDDLIGKGLEWNVILEIAFYIIPTLVPLALPLAILLSSLMAFGKLGETYELTALKSSGISLYKIMSPLLIMICIISITAFFFSNHVIPYSNMKFKTLLYDIMNKKLALNIREGVFFNDIEGYSIKVNRKDAEGRLLEDVLIYDHSEKMGNTKVIKAKRGSMYTSDSDRYLYLDLYDGYSYEEVEPKNPKKRIDSPFARSSFKSQKIRFDMASFQLERSDEERYSNVAQFMNLKQLKESSDSLNSNINNRINTFKEKLLSYYHFESLDSLSFSKKQAEVFSYSLISKNKQKRLTKAAANLVRSSKSYIYNSRRELKYKHKKLRRANVEWHRKFTLSFACIILFLIGAPLGAIIRKGGMGMPVLISILFFLAYHISSITGEKSAIQGVLSIPFGMWLSAFILTPLGVFFTIRAASDSTLFEISLHKNLNMRIKELWNRKKS
jgi:lipopolysaccharide export system permease protein